MFIFSCPSEYDKCLSLRLCLFLAIYATKVFIQIDLLKHFRACDCSGNKV